MPNDDPSALALEKPDDGQHDAGVPLAGGAEPPQAAAAAEGSAAPEAGSAAKRVRKLLTAYESSSDEEEDASGPAAAGPPGGRSADAGPAAGMRTIYGKDLRNAEWSYDPNAARAPRTSGGADRVSRTRHQLSYIAVVARENESAIVAASAKAAEQRKATRTRYGW